MGKMDEQEEADEQFADASNRTDEQSCHDAETVKKEHKKHRKKKKHRDKNSGLTRTENDAGTVAKSSKAESISIHENARSERDTTEEESGSNAALTMLTVNTSTGLAHPRDLKENPGESNLDDSNISSGEDSRILEMQKKKLSKRRRSYKEEKSALNKKLEETRTNFKEEISKYEQELDAKRQEYLSRLSELKLDEQHASLTQCMEDVADLEKALECRLQQCAEQQQEVEDAERFLDRRQQLCNSREEDLRRLDEELDTLHQELELDRDRLERTGFDTSNIGIRRERRNSVYATTSQWGDDDNDYILKANLRKCQANLKKTEETLTSRNEELATLKEQVHSLQNEKKKNLDKIKHLETQLSVALSQLSQKERQSKDTQDRYKSSHSHISHKRLSSANLSINQQAQLRRNISQQGKSDNSDKYTLMSLPSSSGSTMGKSDGDNSPGSSGGSSGESMAFLNGTRSRSESTTSTFISRPRTETTSSTSSQRNVSSACSVM